MKKVIEGYLFITEGCEHGPTVMKWNGEWNQEKYEKLKSDSWCDNNFNWSGSDDAAEEVEFGLKPSKKYRLTIEEI